MDRVREEFYQERCGMSQRLGRWCGKVERRRRGGSLTRPDVKGLVRKKSEADMVEEELR